MIIAIFLYGSRARRDALQTSDTDLLGISRSEKITRINGESGINLHTYPLSWMLKNSAGGNLFLLHVAQEAISLYDPDNVLTTIKENFRYKSSYDGDIEAATRIIAATLSFGRESFDDVIRSRYFWGLRTAIIAAAANERMPIFSARLLEEFSGIKGLNNHITGREKAAFEDCEFFGKLVFSWLSVIPFDTLRNDPSVNLKALTRMGGMAASTAGNIIYR